MTASIPDLGGLMNLKLLWLHTNEFTGAVPDGTMLPASLDDLNLRDNMLMGADTGPERPGQPDAAAAA